jgi:hypothetical protein
MTDGMYASADVVLYSGGSERERATVALKYCDGTVVPVSVPFSRTQHGDRAPEKYARELGKVLDALLEGSASPYGECGWKVPYESREALIGEEGCPSYTEEGERVDLEALKKALKELRGNPERIKVAPFYEPEGLEHLREI